MTITDVSPADVRVRTLTDLVARSVAEFGDRVAVTDETGRRITYAELDEAATRLALVLAAAGVRPEDRVGVYRRRGVNFVVSVLAVLRAGAAYVAVDDRYPDARRDLMLTAARCRLAVVDPDWTDRLDGVCETLGWSSEEPAHLVEAELPEPSPDNAACVLFTSGSTGTPKGVVLEHRNVAAFAVNPALPRLLPADRVAQIANVSFDAVHFEMWGALGVGAELVVMPSLPDLVQSDLRRELRRRRITAMLAPTMAFNHIISEDPDAFGGVRVLHTGGDVVRPSACRDLLAAGFDGTLCNLYGPTEAATAVTVHEITEVTDEAVSVPIGSAVAGASLYVLDDLLEPVPAGQPGELHIGGTGVTRGYLRDPARTAERFLPDPFAGGGAVMYATGDLVRDRGDGVLEYLGRADDQVKIRGYRVEPREVERTLMGCAGVLEVAVLPVGDGQDRKLVAFVAVGPATGPHEVRAHAEHTMPDYQVPAEIMVVPEIPATSHGKRDNARLLGVLADRERRRDTFREPATDSERYLTKLWESLLGMENIGADDDFIALGGHSMLAFRVRKRIQRELGITIRLEDILEATVLSELASTMDRAGAEVVEPVS
ncbi:non-ribosomal peptide synthetase [Streptomyces olivaceus]|uniref:non-ribosomal peptide synthetase n=1 Tax=Streptomyces olivaceus TaxID=47716 RepID=UPI00362D014E